MRFSAWCVHIALSIALVAAIAGGCVKVEKQQAAVQLDSAQLAVQVVDSMAIYRCDNCAFAVAYRRQTSGQVKPCPTCEWVSLNPKVTHNKGDVPELSNLPVNALNEQDALQHNTVHLVTPPTDSGDTPDPNKQLPMGEAVATRKVKTVSVPSGDGQ